MLKVWCLCLLAAGAAYGELGDIVTTFSAPAGNPVSLAYGTRDTQLWVYCDAFPYCIYRVDAGTGSVLASAASPGGPSTRGLTYIAGGYLYVGDSASDYIYLVRSNNTPSVISSFSARHDMYGGLALKDTGDGGVGGEALWSTVFPHYDEAIWNGERSADAFETGAYLHTLPSGSILLSFMPPGGACDVAWDWRNEILWSANGALRAYTETGSLLCSYRYMSGFSQRYLRGLCYDGEYLWAGSYYPTPEILKIHCPGGLGVAPASMGKIKAIYR